MMTQTGMDERAEVLIARGFSNDKAYHYAALIGDVEETDDSGKVLVRDESGKVIDRIEPI